VSGVQRVVFSVELGGDWAGGWASDSGSTKSTHVRDAKTRFPLSVSTNTN